MKLELLLAVFALAETKPRIAVVIDDFGLTYKKNVPDENWYALKFPLTYAVMPESPRTKESARRTKEAGHELIIHFPFDPFLSLELNKEKAGSKDVDSVRKLLEKSFKDIPGPVGINNHRSYKATQNRPLMDAFMPMLKGRNVYFLDSGVSPRTVAYDSARKAGLPALKNDVFIDTAEIHTKEFCAKMMRRAAALARKNGSAVAIGHHYFHGTYDCLREEIPRLQAEGFEFVKASALLP
jgi:polysaccharide deacetylase 2 family uncharacterized protein YibQ